MFPEKKSLAFEVIGDSLVVLRENRLTPRDEDWDAFLAFLTQNRENFPSLKILVHTDGGGPSSDQRKRLAVALGGRPVRVAVVTESVKVRFIVSSIALLNREICTFYPAELEEAYVHLGMSSTERRLSARALMEIEKVVDL